MVAIAGNAGNTIRTTSHTKPLWLAVGVLGAAVIAMAGTLVYLQTRQMDARAAPAMAGLIEPKNLALLGSGPAGDKGMQAGSLPDEVEKPVAAPAKKAPLPAKVAVPKVEKRVLPAGAAQTGASTSVAAAPGAGAGAGTNTVVMHPAQAKPVCAHCGTVESATPVQRAAPASGVGVVAGGVLGAVLGNQVGGGSGKTAATILGAVGGGWAGNEIEKRVKKETVYEVRVRMDDTSTRTFELATAVGAGAKVSVEGRSLRLADGSLASPIPVRSQRQAESRGSPGPNQAGG